MPSLCNSDSDLYKNFSRDLSVTCKYPNNKKNPCSLDEQPGMKTSYLDTLCALNEVDVEQ